MEAVIVATTIITTGNDTDDEANNVMMMSVIMMAGCCWSPLLTDIKDSITLGDSLFLQFSFNTVRFRVEFLIMYV